jgi:signal recognition particle receptor subunit beta
MPYLDHGRQELRLKVVYYGPGLGGKTTNLEQIHRRSRPDRRGKLVALNTEAERTLFFDLLPVELGTFKGYTVRVHLCTVPGQIAHDQTRKLILSHVDGIVFVVDSQHDRLADNELSIRNLETNLRLQGDDPAKMPMVVQYNKRDLPTAAGIATLREVLGVPNEVDQLEAVATRGIGVFDTFKAITKECLRVLGDPAGMPPGRVPSIIPGKHASMFPDAAPPFGASIPPIAAPPPPRFDDE